MLTLQYIFIIVITIIIIVVILFIYLFIYLFMYLFIYLFIYFHSIAYGRLHVTAFLHSMDVYMWKHS